MRARAIASWLVLVVGSSACASSPRAPGPVGVAFDRDAETRSVYAAILNDLYARDWLGREVTQWVVDPDVREVRGGRDELVRNRLSDARPDALADFERPRPAARVPADLAPGRPVRWLTNAEFAALPKDGSGYGWAEFHRRFPGSPGHVTFSRIGFSADGTEAVVEPGCWFDSLGGARTLVRLEKARGTWRVVARAQTAVS